MMTSTIGSAVTGHVIQVLNSGFNSGLALLASGPIARLKTEQVRAQNVAPDIADQSNAMQYPAVNVYCEKIVNNLVEKFRSFSGSAQVTVEIRHSQDRLDGLQDTLENYADAVMQLLNANRGDWGSGMFYGGAYQAAFGPVKHGGRNFLQTAKITFEIGVSRS